MKHTLTDTHTRRCLLTLYLKSRKCENWQSMMWIVLYVCLSVCMCCIYKPNTETVVAKITRNKNAPSRCSLSGGWVGSRASRPYHTRLTNGIRLSQSVIWKLGRDAKGALDFCRHAFRVKPTRRGGLCNMTNLNKFSTEKGNCMEWGVPPWSVGVFPGPSQLTVLVPAPRGVRL